MNLNPFAMAAAMIFFAGSVFGQNQIVKNSDFKEGLKHWMGDERLALPASETGFTTEMVEGTECLAAIGTGKQEKKSFQIVQHIPLPQADILGKKVTFSADIKPVNISGTFLFMIREATKKGSIRYRKITVNKWSPKEWKRYTAEFVVFKPTEFIQIYFQTNYLEPGDKILVKNMSVTITERSK